jgi:hypothetical protein
MNQLIKAFIFDVTKDEKVINLSLIVQGHDGEDVQIAIPHTNNAIPVYGLAKIRCELKEEGDDDGFIKKKLFFEIQYPNIKVNDYVVQLNSLCDQRWLRFKKAINVKFSDVDPDLKIDMLIESKRVDGGTIVRFASSNIKIIRAGEVLFDSATQNVNKNDVLSASDAIPPSMEGSTLVINKLTENSCNTNDSAVSPTSEESSLVNDLQGNSTNKNDSAINSMLSHLYKRITQLTFEKTSFFAFSFLLVAVCVNLVMPSDSQLMASIKSIMPIEKRSILVAPITIEANSPLSATQINTLQTHYVSHLKEFFNAHIQLELHVSNEQPSISKQEYAKNQGVKTIITASLECPDKKECQMQVSVYDEGNNWSSPITSKIHYEFNELNYLAELLPFKLAQLLGINISRQYKVPITVGERDLKRFIKLRSLFKGNDDKATVNFVLNEYEALIEIFENNPSWVDNSILARRVFKLLYNELDDPYYLSSLDDAVSRAKSMEVSSQAITLDELWLLRTRVFNWKKSPEYVISVDTKTREKFTKLISDLETSDTSAKLIRHEKSGMYQLYEDWVAMHGMYNKLAPESLSLTDLHYYNIACSNILDQACVKKVKEIKNSKFPEREKIDTEHQVDIYQTWVKAGKPHNLDPIFTFLNVNELKAKLCQNNQAQDYRFFLYMNLALKGDYQLALELININIGCKPNEIKSRYAKLNLAYLIHQKPDLKEIDNLMKEIGEKPNVESLIYLPMLIELQSFFDINGHRSKYRLKKYVELLNASKLEPLEHREALYTLAYAGAWQDADHYFRLVKADGVYGQLHFNNPIFQFLCARDNSQADICKALASH